MLKDTIIDRALITAKTKLQSQIDAQIEEKLAQQEVRFQNRLAEEKGFADVGRAVLNALRSRDGSLPYVPAAGMDRLAAKYALMGKDFDTLMEAVKADVMLTSEWERFAMMLRMSQED